MKNPRKLKNISKEFFLNMTANAQYGYIWRLQAELSTSKNYIIALESEIGEYTRTTVRLNKRDKEQATEIEKQRNYIIVLESEKRDDRRCIMITKEFFENMSIVAIRNYIIALESERKDYKKTTIRLNRENERKAAEIEKLKAIIATKSKVLDEQYVREADK